MLKIVYCAEGHHVSDDNVLAYVDSVFWEYDFGGRMDVEVKVGNELIVDGFVLRVLEKKFNADEIEIYDNDMKLEIDNICGLVAPDECKVTLGAHARITAQILKLGCANIKARSSESEE